MTKKQVEKFAVGYEYPTDYIEIVLEKCKFNKDEAQKILQKPYDEVIKLIQGI